MEEKREETGEEKARFRKINSLSLIVPVVAKDFLLLQQKVFVYH